tara:strand:- start:2217 stop:2933 length:717 start_codon:yes stop_codon:yes gene_type:complete
MGRPLNKRYFGPPTDAGNEIRVTFWNGFASVQGWIIKQTGSKKFLCSDGTNEFECMLSNKDGAVANSHPSAPEDAAIGEMTITILTDAQKAVQVEKISAHKVRADDGEMYPWTFEASNYDGVAQIEEAGGEILHIVDSITFGTSSFILTVIGHGLASGDAVHVDGGSLTELSTAGVNGGNGYYVNRNNDDEITLHTGFPITLGNIVDSTNFINEYTGGGTLWTIEGTDFDEFSEFNID